MKQALLIILIGLIGCKPSTKPPEVRKEEKGFVFTIVTTPKEGKKIWALSHRTIFIKEVVGDKVTWDTAWHYPAAKDTTGKNPNGLNIPLFAPIGKDSVKWKGIEGVIIDSLLK